MKVSEIPIEERPREKGLRFGVEHLSNREILAILLRCGTKKYSVLDLADRVLLKAEGLKGLVNISIPDLEEIHGMSRTKALEIKASLELARRINYQAAQEGNVVHSPQALYSWLQTDLGMQMQEEMKVLFLDRGNHILKEETVFKGTDYSCMLQPKTIVRKALQYGTASLILVHNHPGGSKAPSKEDISATKNMMRSAKMMDLHVIDHIIVTTSGCFSFANHGLIEMLEKEVSSEKVV